MSYNINSANYFVLNKIKLQLAIKIKSQYKDNNNSIPNIIKK